MITNEVEKLDINYCDSKYRLLDKNTRILYDKVVSLGNKYN